MTIPLPSQISFRCCCFKRNITSSFLTLIFVNVFAYEVCFNDSAQMSRIIVKNLPDKITKEKLNQIFSVKGVITDIQLKYTKDGVFRKFAFIGFQKPEMAEAAKESYNKSFINTSQIQVEICSDLGDPKKPRAWSKYAPENLKRFHENTKEEAKAAKIPKLKGKIKDPKVLELLKNHKDDQLFKEFLDVNGSEVTACLNIVLNKESEEIDEEKNDIAKKDVSDSEYLKLKTGVDLNLEAKPKGPVKGGKAVELFTVKLSGLPCKVKKSQIKEFLNPLKPFTIRRALKIKGVAYCGFKTEKEMKTAAFKNKSFLSGKRIFVTPVKKKPLADKKTEEKWKSEEEKLKGLETVAESGRIFVRNLPYTVTEEDLKGIFEKYGTITDFILPIDSFTRKPKGFGIVTFLIPEHACKAFNELDGTIFQGRMLHLLPALPKKSIEEEDDDNLDDPFKKKKRKKEKQKSGSSNNWNTFFIGENALAEVMAATYNTTKENVLDDKKGGTSVRLALGETQIINKMKEFLEENDVCLEAFENMLNCTRSKTVILVKNLPFGTKEEEIRERFCKFGELKRVVLPPSGVAALVEFIEPSEAKAAFRRLAYSKFKHIPMYLEWAPEAVFRNRGKTEEDKIINSEQSTEKMLPEKRLENIQNHVPVEGAILFVKNLNFSTDDESLRNHFSTCGEIVSATIARKRNPAAPGKMLSMGYGFVEFAGKESADKALTTLQFSSLDNHRIELKRSHRTLSSDASGRMSSKGNNKPSTTILVRNIPFQATLKEVTDIFKVFGEIKSVRLPKKMVGTGSHRGFCFVEYNTVEDAKRALGALSQSTHFYGRRLVLEWASTDDGDVATLREKTAKQFKTGTITNAERKKNIKIDEKKNQEEEEE